MQSRPIDTSVPGDQGASLALGSSYLEGGQSNSARIAGKRRWLATWHDGDEEWLNALTHGLGLLLALLATAALLKQAAGYPLYAVRVACWVYSLTLVAVYAASTASHWVQEPRWKHRLAVWDQAVIYLMIVGTFTPFASKYLVTGLWPVVPILMWCLAVAGFVSKVVFEHRIRGISFALYLGLGWLPVVTFPYLFWVAPLAGLGWGLAGGLAYSVGTICLAKDRCLPYLHTAWHLLVIVGSGCHWYAVWRYVLA